MRQQYATRSLILVGILVLVGVGVIAQMIRIQNSAQAKVFLKLWVKVSKDWKKNPLLSGECERLQNELDGSGRLLIRASGTEPVLRVMVEARDAGTARLGDGDFESQVSGRLA